MSSILIIEDHAILGKALVRLLTEKANQNVVAVVHSAEEALEKLMSLRKHLDGCGSAPDRNDWVRNCADQIKIRALVDLLIANLTASRVSVEKVRKFRVFAPRTYVSVDFTAREAQVYKLKPGEGGRPEIVSERRAAPESEPLRRQITSRPCSST